MIIDPYLEYLRLHWWLHICFDVWLQILVIGFIFYGLFILNKQRKLRKYGKLTNGLVIDKLMNESRDNNGVLHTQYLIKYIFTDINPKSIIYGYINNTENEFDLLIPLSIFELISRFHGLNKYELGSIIEEEALEYKIWNTLCIGDKIDILFHPKHPKMIQIPKLKFKYAISKGYKLIFICCVVFGISLYLWYYASLINDEITNDTRNASLTFLTAFLLFLTYLTGSLLIVILCFSCYGIHQLRVHHQMNSSFMHAKYRKVYNNDDDINNVINEQMDDGKEDEGISIFTTTN